MALVKCNECGKEISDKSPICIHCGYTNYNLVKKKIIGIWGKIFLIALIAFPLSLLYILFGIIMRNIIM